MPTKRPTKLEHSTLVKTGSSFTLVGTVVWLAAVTAEVDGALATGLVFASAGMGMLAAAAAKALWPPRRGALPMVLTCGAFLAGAAVWYLVLDGLAGTGAA